jgi:hypothetical protein
MLPLFCVRLALGMLASLLLLDPATINPRFFRTHFLTALALGSLASLLIVSGGTAFPVALGVALALAFLGSAAWFIEGAPGGRALIVLTAAAMAWSLYPAPGSWREPLLTQARQSGLWWLADDVSAAILLGAALTAMLMGHSYLIAPTMTLSPLRRLLIALYIALLARAAVAGVSLWLWTGGQARLRLTEVAVLWLPLRWGLGLLLPGVLGGLAWQTTRLRNTQSSTGILYIVVVFVFLGELTAQLLFSETGYFL